MKIFLLPFIFVFISLNPLKLTAKSNSVDEPERQTKVLISTDYGDITLLLYNATPLHRDNFIKNIKAGIYDSLLFHRVIANFMIQGGDPESKNAEPGTMLGNGGLNYTVKAEISKDLFHKKGALCAARQGDDVNPNKESSSTQFYIVQGQVYTDEMIQKMEARINQMTQNAIFFELLELEENKMFKERFNTCRDTKDQEGTMKLYVEMKEQILKIFNERGGEFKFTEAQKEVYKTLGGAAHLDGNYTVFGEVTEGLDVIDKIANEKVDGNNRPLKDIKMVIKIISE